jgi:hypothetical protein
MVSGGELARNAAILHVDVSRVVELFQKIAETGSERSERTVDIS